MNIVQTVKSAFDKMSGLITLQDATMLFLRLWVAKIFYTSGRTKAAAPDNDLLIDLDVARETLRDIAGDEATYAAFDNVLTDEQGYYVSELTEFSNNLFPDSGITEKIEQTFAPWISPDISAFFTASENAGLLFEDEYQVPLLSPEFAAQLAILGETFLPFMLILGIGTRFGALGLLGMTLVIQTVYPHLFYDHMVWAAALIGVLLIGPGKISLDSLIAKKLS